MSEGAPKGYRISRRQMLGMLSGTVVTSVLAACAPTAPAAPAAPAAAAPTAAAKDAAPTAKPEVPAAGAKTVVVWGKDTTAQGGNKTMIDAFNAAHKDLQIKAESVPSVAGQSPDQMQKIMTAIAAGTVPDFFWLDRFLAVDFASRKAILPLDDYIAAGTLKREDFIAACWDEGNWNGKQWNIPASEGNIGYWSLAYNKDLYKAAGLDPEKPPKTWTECMEYALKMTKRDDSGGYKQIGMVPLWGASFLYEWAWSNGANLLSEDGRKITLTDPKVVEAVDFIAKFYKDLGGAENIQAFQAGFQTAANDPFLTGQIGQVVYGEYQLPDAARYKPDLNMGVTWFPTPKEGDPKVSWVGGWSWALPKGCKQPAEAYKAAEWLAAEGGIMAYQEGQAALASQTSGTWIPLIAAHLKSNEMGRAKYLDPLKAKSPTLAAAYEFYYNAPKTYDKLYFRPKCLIAAQLWDAQVKAAQEAAYGQKTAAQACKDWQDKTQTALDEAWQKTGA
jgi:multiple sugar transport system substrate-binding protein